MIEEPSKYERAKKRVEKIKGFYVHLGVYIVINLFIVFWNLNGFEGSWGNRGFFGLFSTPILWGIGLAIHGLSVFGPNLLLGKNWERRQIQKFMEQDEEESRKFK